MLVKTNITDYKLNKEAILRDFDVAGVSFEGKEKPEELFKAMSLPYADYGIISTFTDKRNGRFYLYFLGEKGHTHFIKYMEDMRRLDLYSMKAQPVHFLSKNFLDEYILIQLLLGCLGSERKKWIQLPYGNYLGGIYANKMPYTAKMEKSIPGLTVHGDTILFNRIFYSRDKTIYVRVETWMPFVYNLLLKKKQMKRYRFVMEKDRLGRYMIKVPWSIVKEKMKVWAAHPDDMSMFKNWYIKGSYFKSLNNAMPYYTLAPGKQLDDKLKIYIEFIEEVNKELGEYLTFIPVSKNFERLPLKKNKLLKQEICDLNEEIVRLAEDKGITIVAEKMSHQEKAGLLKAWILSRYPLPDEKVQIGSTFNRDGWNIQIVDKKSTFIDNKGHHDILSDNYRDLESTCIQHIEEETISDKDGLEAKLDVCMTELLIKDGFLHCKMAKCLAPGRRVSVAVSRRLNTNQEEEKPVYEYFGLTIDSDGTILETVHFSSKNWPKTYLEEDIRDAFDRLNEDVEGRTLRTPEGIIRFDEEQFHAIYRTTQRPLPDYAKLLYDYEAQKRQKKLPLTEVLAMMDNYNRINPQNAEKIREKLEEAKREAAEQADEEGNIEVLDWKKALAASGISHQNHFYGDMEKTYPGKVIFQIHNKTGENNPYEIDKTFGICYKEMENFCEYYVGLRKVGSVSGATIRCGVPIRLVETDESFTFSNFAPLLDVVWVRRGTEEPTVLPFPFKILREYMKSEDNKKRLAEMKAAKKVTGGGIK